ncbi:hypothetical protein GGC47_004902 [Bosea sp. OAE752]
MARSRLAISSTQAKEQRTAKGVPKRLRPNQMPTRSSKVNAIFQRVG